MNAFDILCERFALGKLLNPPRLVSGGFTHTVWQMQTTCGNFCVKQLNQDTQPVAKVLRHIVSYNNVAQRMSQLGVNSVSALSHAGKPYTVLDEHIYLIFPWCDGVVLPFQAVTKIQAQKMATLLAHCHQAHLTASDLIESPWNQTECIDWAALLATLDGTHDENIFQLHLALPALLDWQQRFMTADSRLAEDKVLSHRDLYQSNIIWIEERPQVIDWESAGLIYPSVELFNLAINWSGVTTGHCQRDIYQTILETYGNIMGFQPRIDANVIYASFRSWLGWLRYKLLRLKNTSICDDKVRCLARAQIPLCLESLTLLSELAAGQFI